MPVVWRFTECALCVNTVRKRVDFESIAAGREVAPPMIEHNKCDFCMSVLETGNYTAIELH